MKTWFWISIALTLTGVLLTTVGAYMIWPPAGWIVPGISLATIGLLRDFSDK